MASQCLCFVALHIATWIHVCLYLQEALDATLDENRR